MDTFFVYVFSLKKKKSSGGSKKRELIEHFLASKLKEMWVLFKTRIF